MRTFIPFRNTSCKQAYGVSGTTDLGSLLPKEQQQGTALCRSSLAWKQLGSCQKMKDRVCQSGNVFLWELFNNKSMPYKTGGVQKIACLILILHYSYSSAHGNGGYCIQQFIADDWLWKSSVHPCKPHCLLNHEWRQWASKSQKLEEITSVWQIARAKIHCHSNRNMKRAIKIKVGVTLPLHL